MARLLEVLASLKLAVCVVLSMAFAMALGTTLESIYDTPTAQFWVYRALWFHAILTLLGVNIFFVMVSRWPWKKHHLPFLLAHIGILLLLFGSWQTDHFGVDGMMRIGEGESRNRVEMDRSLFVVSNGLGIQNQKITAIPWIPPVLPDFLEPLLKFKPIDAGYGIVVTDYLAHADVDYTFLPTQSGGESQGVGPALKINLAGGPMRVSQDFWLWQADASWATRAMGPAQFAFGVDLPAAPGRPQLIFSSAHSKSPANPKNARGSVTYESRSSQGKILKGEIRADSVFPLELNVGWAASVKVTVLEYIPQASLKTEYRPSRFQLGQQAPPSAIRVAKRDEQGREQTAIWLGLGDNAFLPGSLRVDYVPSVVVLPFGIQLDRFDIERYPGTQNPAAYSSRVRVVPEGATPHVISMNEPLKHGGFTFYQASYEDAEPRPTVSILSVNRDPGRPAKYIGSLLIVLGAIILFRSKLKVQKKR